MGSAGYAYSAGGRKLSHVSGLMQAVPIAPYRRAFKPMILNNAAISITADRSCSLIVDGIYIKELKPNETVNVRRGNRLKFFKGVGWYEQG
jgi:NAD kinase